MKKITPDKFHFNDVVLYAKCWYERTDNVFEDLKKCLEHDNKYNIWPGIKPRDICKYMLMCLEEIYSFLDEDDKKNNFWLCSHSSFLDQIEHRIHFYENTYEEAIVYTVLGILRCLTKEQIELIPPKYGKGMRRIGCMFRNEMPKSMTYAEMNRMAKKMFSE